MVHLQTISLCVCYSIHGYADKCSRYSYKIVIASFEILRPTSEKKMLSRLNFTLSHLSSNSLFLTSSNGTSLTLHNLSHLFALICGQISIADGCANRRTIKHELMHRLGFIHEQSRPDRDEFVHVVEENINPEGSDFLHLNHLWMFDYNERM